MRLNIIKNPFEPEIRIEKEIKPDKPICDLVKNDLPSCDYSIILDNRELIAEEIKSIVPTEGQTLAIVARVKGGGGKEREKNPLYLVASIAMMIAVPYLYSTVAGAKWLGTAAAGLASLAAGGFAVVGGYLLNKWFPATATEIDNIDAVYNWGNIPAMAQEGSGIQMTFGTAKVGACGQAQILNHYVHYDNDKQYINILYCGGEGPCDYDGEDVTGISNIKINDNPIANYQGIEVFKRAGLNNQKIIDKFNDSYDPKSLAYELEKGAEWSKEFTNGQAEGLELVFVFPGGLYHQGKNGKLEEAWVEIEIQHREAGTTDWISWEKLRIKGKQNEPIFKPFKKHHIVSTGAQPVRFEVRARYVANSGEGNDYMNRITWTTLTGILYDDLIRPNRILLGITALATDQLSGGLPAVTWNQTRSKVWVWMPENEADPYGPGNYQQKAADNPAWAAYDLVHGCYRIQDVNTGKWAYKVKRVPANKIIYSDFKAWAEYCDSINLKCNLMIDKIQSLWDALKPIESVGRGKVCQFGTKLGAVCDRPVNVTQVFNYSNIVLDSFNGEFIGKTERANALEVSFLDKERDYKKVTFPVFADGYDEATAISNPTQIFLQACTSFEQAWREANYRLRLNKYIIRSAAWKSEVDSIACRIGDVVAVSTPKWGVGGRIVNVGADWIEVPTRINAFGEFEDLQMAEDKSYICKIRLADDTKITKAVSKVEITADNTNKIYFTESFLEDTLTATYNDGTHFTVSADQKDNLQNGKTDLIIYGISEDIYQATIISRFYVDGKTKVECDFVPSDICAVRYAFTKPDSEDLYSFGEVDTYGKLFRLSRIQRDDDLVAELSAVEYIPEVYDEAATVPERSLIADIGFISNLTVTDTTDLAGNLFLNIAWLPPRISYSGALVEVNGKQVGKTNYGNSFACPIYSLGTYYIKVTALDYFENPFGTKSISYVPVGDAPPPEVKGLTSYFEGEKLFLIWDYAYDHRSILYEVRKGENWNGGKAFVRTSTNKFETIGDGTYWVAAYYRTQCSQPIPIVVEGSTAVSNIVARFDESATSWKGTFSEGAIAYEGTIDELDHFDIVDNFDMASFRVKLSPTSTEGYYTIPSNHIVDVSTNSNCLVIGNVAKIQPTGTKAVIQINVADNDGVYKGWEDLDSGRKYIGRYFNFRLKLTAEKAGITPTVSDFEFIVDMPDVLDHGAGIAIAAAENTITLNKTFHSVPSVVITIVNASPGDDVVITNSTKNDFTFYIQNNGVKVARTINWVARGY